MRIATWFQVTHDFLPAFKVFWRTLLQHNPRELFGEVIIQTNEWIEELANQGFRQRPLINRFRGWPAFEPRILPCYGKLEALECSEYDQILVLDSDMICTGSLAEIFSSEAAFLAVGIQTNKRLSRFNGGLWCARPPAIGNPNAINWLSSQTHRFFDDCDQSALSVYLKMMGIEPALFSLRYNLQIGFATEEDLRPRFLQEREDCRILHITGPTKPWLGKPPEMGDREPFRQLWQRAEAGEKITSKDVRAIQI
jgi:hypothetical protein